jgi:dynactin complex subunit
MSRILKLPSLKSSSEDDKIGQRVILPTLDNVTGTLRYLGPIDSKQGTWAGIELDDVTLGKNDGSVQG